MESLALGHRVWHPLVMAKSSTVIIDDIDKALLVALQKDGRLPYTKLAARVGLSEAAVRQRVQRLIEGGVTQIVAITDPLTLGYRRMAMIGIRVEGDLRDTAATLADLTEVANLMIKSPKTKDEGRVRNFNNYFLRKSIFGWNFFLIPIETSKGEI